MADYRDERETLRRQRQELAENLEQAHHELTAKEAEIRKLQAELVAARAPPPPPFPLGVDPTERSKRRFSRRALLIALAAFGTLTLVAVVVVVTSARPASPAVAPDRLLTAHVSAATGRSTPKNGTRCELKIRANPSRFSRFNCHVSVSCEQEPLYGARHGFCTCAVRDGMFATASDPWPSDGDPALSVDAVGGTASVFTKDWRVDMRLDRPEDGPR